MIDSESRFIVLRSRFSDDDDSMTWDFWDWDQRRHIAVTIDESMNYESAMEYLSNYADGLDPSVGAVNISAGGDIVSCSSNPFKDSDQVVWYPSLQQIQCSPHTSTICRTALRELDRLAPNVDLVTYTTDDQTARIKTSKVVFKYYLLNDWLRGFWNEMNIWMRISGHPNIVPFDRLVLDEVHGNVVGFTTEYIPGGTMKDNRSRMFKLEWLTQLIDLVDFLNFQLGIMHQDIAPQNLLVDSATDRLLLFDFDCSGRIPSEGYTGCRDDVKGVVFTLYEIITRDESFRELPHRFQNADDVQRKEKWVEHPDTLLDSDVSAYRQVLEDWVAIRANSEHDLSHGKLISWPELPDSEVVERVLEENSQWDFAMAFESSWHEPQQKKPVPKKSLCWTRTPQSGLRRTDP